MRSATDTRSADILRNRAAVAAALLCLVCCTTTAQPFIELGIGGNVVFPKADFGGTANDFLAGRSYGSGPGAGIHLASRFRVEGIPLRASINYSILKKVGLASSGTVDMAQKIFSLSLQPEYTFSTDRTRTRGYVGGILDLNNFGGDVTFAGVPGIADNIYTISASARLGLGFAAGLLFPLNERTTADVALSYHLMNVFGKRWVEDPAAANAVMNAYQSLNDAPDPLYAPGDPNHFIGSPRRIHTLQLTLSFFFSFTDL